VIPDATFGPAELDLYKSAEPGMPCDSVAMVLGVTSTKPQADRETKRHCYARAGIPLYLLVDRDVASVTLFSDPGKRDYRELRTVPFGKPLTLPDPFVFDLDTSDFL
jgi:Uma2 family endonuclease